MKMLTVEFPDCDHEWDVTEEALRQSERDVRSGTGFAACAL
jgi:hypothetical protein